MFYWHGCPGRLPDADKIPGVTLRIEILATDWLAELLQILKNFITK